MLIEHVFHNQLIQSKKHHKFMSTTFTLDRISKLFHPNEVWCVVPFVTKQRSISGNIPLIYPINEAWMISKNVKNLKIWSWVELKIILYNNMKQQNTSQILMWRWRSTCFSSKSLNCGHELMREHMNDLWWLQIHYHRGFVFTTSILGDLGWVPVCHQRCRLRTMQTLQLRGGSDASTSTRGGHVHFFQFDGYQSLNIVLNL